LCHTNARVLEVVVGGKVEWQYQGGSEIEGPVGQPCYGMKLEVAQGGTLTINGITYREGDKLTVDKDLNYVMVCSWDGEGPPVG
jgi:hypothetical protein